MQPLRRTFLHRNRTVTRDPELHSFNGTSILRRCEGLLKSRERGVSEVVDMIPHMNTRHRTGSDSRCCDPNLAPLQWRGYVDESHPSVLALSTWMTALAPWARAHEQGEIDDLMDAAANGDLWDSGDERTRIKPIREDPEIFELRHTALSKKLRFYHGEPQELPRGLIALHRHIKLDNQSQQTEIIYAAERYASGTATEWQ